MAPGRDLTPAGSRGAPKRARAASARKHRLHCARNVRLAAGSDVALLSQQGRYLSKRTLLIAQFLRYDTTSGLASAMRSSMALKPGRSAMGSAPTLHRCLEIHIVEAFAESPTPSSGRGEPAPKSTSFRSIPRRSICDRNG